MLLQRVNNIELNIKQNIYTGTGGNLSHNSMILHFRTARMTVYRYFSWSTSKLSQLFLMKQSLNLCCVYLIKRTPEAATTNGL